jgi:hypothetical protein
MCYIRSLSKTQCHLRLHRAEEFLKFLRQIDKAVPAPRDIHLVLDGDADPQTAQRSVCPLNATHKTPDVKVWLANHPRFNLHFTPISVSWLNFMKHFFTEISSKRIRRSSYSSVKGHGYVSNNRYVLSVIYY